MKTIKTKLLVFLVTNEDGAGYQKSGHSCADGSLPLVMAVAHPAAEGGVSESGPCVFFEHRSFVVFWVCYERL